MPIATITAQELKNHWNKNPDLVLIDVRELEEWQAGHIPGAVHIPKATLLSEIPKRYPNSQQALYLHCKGGIRSHQAATELAHLGYSELYSLEGGISAWTKEGYAIKQ